MNRVAFDRLEVGWVSACVVLMDSSNESPEYTGHGVCNAGCSWSL